jgi:hypothetical protein
MAVYFHCKSCGSEHRSPAGFLDRESFDATPMRDTRFTCYSTGTTMTYARTDMYWHTDSAELSDAGLRIHGASHNAGA